MATTISTPLHPDASASGESRRVEGVQGRTYDLAAPPARPELVIGELELRFEEFRDRFADREGQVPVVLSVSADGTELSLMTRESGVGTLLEEWGFGPIATSGDPYVHYLDALTLPRFVDTLDDLVTGQEAR